MNEAEQESIVKDFYIKNTKVKISNLCCRGRTNEEVEVILMRIARQSQEAISTAEPQTTKEAHGKI
jgi:hypothetical protein